MSSSTLPWLVGVESFSGVELLGPVAEAVLSCREINESHFSFSLNLGCGLTSISTISLLSFSCSLATSDSRLMKLSGRDLKGMKMKSEDSY